MGWLPAQFIEAIGNLRSTGQRSLLALLGIVVGSASVIAMINIGRMVEEESLSQFRALGTDMIAITIQSWGQDQPVLTMSEYQAFKAEMDVFRVVAPIIRGDFGQFVYQGKPVSTSTVATTPDFFEVAKVGFSGGRNFSIFDTGTPFMVTGASAFRTTAGDIAAPRVGAPVQGEAQAFTIIGTLDSAPTGALLSVDVDTTTFVSTAIARRIKNAPIISISSIIGRIRHGIDETIAEQKIEEALMRINPNLQIEIRLAKAELDLMREQARILSLFLTTVGSIALLVGGVGVMNIMLVSVAERRREIGLRLAIGARPKDITALFFVEAMILSLVGGLIGMVLGIGASYVTAGYIEFKFFISNFAILLGIGVSVAVGVFFGYYPARQASRLDPVECLRSE